MTDNESRWRASGLLEAYGRGSQDAEILANNLQKCADFLISKVPFIDHKYFDETLYLLLQGEPDTEYVAGFLLPIIVRLQMERNIKTIDVRELYYKFLKYKKSWKPSYGPGYYAMDDEAEMCSDFTKDF